MEWALIGVPVSKGPPPSKSQKGKFKFAFDNVTMRCSLNIVTVTLRYFLGVVIVTMSYFLNVVSVTMR